MLPLGLMHPGALSLSLSPSSKDKYGQKSIDIAKYVVHIKGKEG
jgi:hypothetical protein